MSSQSFSDMQGFSFSVFGCSRAVVWPGVSCPIPSFKPSGIVMSAKEAFVYQRTKRRPEHRCPRKNVRCRRKLKLADFQCRRAILESSQTSIWRESGTTVECPLLTSTFRRTSVQLECPETFQEHTFSPKTIFSTSPTKHCKSFAVRISVVELRTIS